MGQSVTWQDRAHFFAVFGNHDVADSGGSGSRQGSAKRGGQVLRLNLDEYLRSPLAPNGDSEDRPNETVAGTPKRGQAAETRPARRANAGAHLPDVVDAEAHLPRPRRDLVPRSATRPTARIRSSDLVGVMVRRPQPWFCGE